MWQNQVQGSAHMGDKTLNAVYRAALGLDPPTTLTERVVTFFGLSSAEEVLHAFTNRLQPPPDRVDQLASILLDEAQNGDRAMLEKLMPTIPGDGLFSTIS